MGADLQCINGHQLPSGSTFCGLCGSGGQSEQTCRHGMPIIGEHRCGFCSKNDLQQIPTTPVVAAPSQSPNVRELQSYSNLSSSANDAGLKPPNNNTVLISIITVLSVVLVIIGFSFISSKSTERATKQMTVSLTVIDIDMSDCFDLSLGYGDVPGSTVTVSTDIKDTYGSLDQMGESTFGICEWKTTLMVPENAEQYAVTIGKRGTKFYSNSEVVISNWEIELTLG